MALKSLSTIAGTILTFTCTDSETNESFTREIELSLFAADPSPLAKTAISFAAKTALRNSTGGRELDEAEAAVDARIAAWQSGEWGAERGAAGEALPIGAGHVLSKAVARVYAQRFTDASAAATALSEMLEKTLAAAGHPDFASLDDENQRKARNAFVKEARERDGAVDAAIAAIQAEQAASRAAKKAASTSSGSMF